MKSVLIFDPQMESYLTKWMLQQTPFMVRTPIAKELMPAYVKKRQCNVPNALFGTNFYTVAFRLKINR